MIHDNVQWQSGSTSAIVGGNLEQEARQDTDVKGRIFPVWCGCLIQTRKAWGEKTVLQATELGGAWVAVT